MDHGNTAVPCPPGLDHAIRMSSTSEFPPISVTGLPVAIDLNRQNVFLGVVPYKGSYQPCKVVKELNPRVRYGFELTEHATHDDYYLVPFNNALMEWVRTSHGVVPRGKVPVGGAREAHGPQLLHALAVLPGIGVKMVGKASAALNGARIPFGGVEVFVLEYEILCWRDQSGFCFSSTCPWRRTTHEPSICSTPRPAGLEHAIPMSSTSEFPPTSVAGMPVVINAVRESIYLAVVPYGRGMQPGKVVKGAQRLVRFGCDMVEHTATSEYFIVPFDNEQMEWVQTSHGRVPAGKRPVGGAREGDSRGTLLHALAKLPGHKDKMVGKAGPYLQGALVLHDGAEVFAAEYEILCWR